MNGWKELYDKKKRPGINELSAYLPADVMVLFSEFANHLAREYGLHCAPAVYTITYGWVFKFGRSDMYLISGLTIADDSFNVEGISVNNRDSFIHGAWYKFNMYEVYKAEYSKLEKLISTDEIAQKWLDEIKESESGRIYIDCDVNPRAVIIVKDNNECYKLGEGKDCQFEEGLKWFYEQ